jgi:hypothetical protein
VLAPERLEPLLEALCHASAAGTRNQPTGSHRASADQQSAWSREDPRLASALIACARWRSLVLENGLRNRANDPIQIDRHG